MALKTLSWAPAASITGKTLTGYQVRNGTTVLKTVGVVLTTDHDFTAGSTYNVTVRAIFSDGTYGSDTNIVVVDLSAPAAYDPALDSSVKIALLSDTNTPQDVSTVGGLGVTPNNNHMIAAGGSYTLPTNSGGMNTFVAANLTLLKRTTTTAAYILSSTPFTMCMEMALTSLTAVNTEDIIMQSSGAADSFTITNFNTKFQIRVGAIASQLEKATYWTVNVPRIVTLKRNTSNIVTIQFDNDTPITLYAGAAKTDEYGFDVMGGSKSSISANSNCKIGRYILCNVDKTGTDLDNVKAWVAAGTP